MWQLWTIWKLIPENSFKLGRRTEPVTLCGCQADINRRAMRMIWYLFQIGKPHVVYDISDTTPLIWRIIHGMAVTKKKLAESRDRMRGHQNTCQCFEVSASFDHLSMSPRLVTRLCISASGGSSLPGLPARSVLSWKCWPLSLQPKFSYFWTKIMFAFLHAGYTKRM